MPARKQSGVEGDFTSPTEGRSRGKDNGKEKETFGCPYPGCGQVYSRMEYLKRHQRKHQDVRPFVCKDCAKSFARSDVLLRHRRRCHPTPPPADRSSRSPPPMHRGYPGVPISSSRHDDRDNSPSQTQPGRKHSRPSSSGEADGQPTARRRMNPEEEEEEDDGGRYGESSRFRHNDMGTGDAYDLSSYYGGESSYTPHLLPMFQQAPNFVQNPNYHSPDDPTHLEDASALLSIAYGSSSQENGSAAQQPAQANGVDPNIDQNLFMMMDGSGAKQAADKNGTTVTTGVSGALDGEQNALNDATGNFLAAMNWLGAGKTATASSEGADAWPNNFSSLSKPASPFPLNAFLSPSAFAFGSDDTATGGVNGQNENQTSEEASQAVMNLLNQIAKYEVPQTRANPNPERPLLRLAHSELLMRAGPEPSSDSRFHMPADRFAGCYQIPHWALPPLRTLSLMANRTFDTVLNHFSFVHTPTFKLTDTAACLAFAICTVGGIRTGAHQWGRLRESRDLSSSPTTAQIALDGPVPPGNTWESMYNSNFHRGGPDDEDVKNVEGWANGHIVRNEKTNMLVKSFSLAQGVLMTEYNVALLQALVLYHAPYFLSEEENERALANMFLGTIVNITRQIGFFSQELEHFNTKIQYPDGEYTINELDLYWRRWIQLETRRRTAYLVYHLDTVSAIESNIPCILSACELSLIPLPAPDSLWKAANAEEWLKAVRNYTPMTLDEAMRRIFFLPTYGAFDTLHENADTKYYNLLNQTELGPFARVAMVITLLRGIMDVGEGKRDRGDWRDLTDLWLSCTWLRPGKKMLDSQGNDLGQPTEASLRDRFASGLDRWRQGWDFDPTCINPAAASTTSNASPASTTSPESNASADAAQKKLNYCEEALPYYWLAQGLLNILKMAPPHEPGWNVFAPGPGNNGQGIKYGDMLKSARMFTRMGEGVGVLATPPSGPGTNGSSTNGFGSVPSTTGSSAGLSTGLSSTTGGEGTGLDGINMNEFTNDGSELLDGMAFEEFLGVFGGNDILAS